MHIGSGMTLKLEHVACCVCGGRDGTPCLHGHDVEFRTCDNHFRFLRCAGCGHVYLSPRPRLDEMDVIYRNYLTTNRGSAYAPSPLVAWIKDAVFDRRRLRPVLRRLRPGANVLDIGAGAGRLLFLLRRVSRVPLNLWANDFSFDPDTDARFRRDNVRTLTGAIEFCATDETFDAITGIHVIEHVLDPPAVFRWAFAHLNPGGALYLETPDYGTVLRRLFGNNWGHTHFPRHLNLFSKAHLARLAADAGFVVERHRNTTSAPAWNMSIRNTLGMDALTKHRSVFEVFNYTNPFTLGFFTLVDLALLALRVPTSTQQLVAVKPTGRETRAGRAAA